MFGMKGFSGMQRFIGGMAVAIGGVAAMPAGADVSAEDVWANAMAPFAALNAEIEASPVREGNRLIVDDLAIRFSFAEGRGRLLLTTNGVSFEENGDGTVSVLYPEAARSKARLEFEGEDGATEAVVLTREMDGTAFEQVASGVPGEVTHAISTDALVQVMRLRGPEGAGGFDVDMTVRMTGTTGTYRVTEGDLVTVDGAFDYGHLLVDSISESMGEGLDGEAPVPVVQTSLQDMTDLRMAYRAALPKGRLSLMNLSAGLRDGLAFSVTSEVAATTTETVINSDGQDLVTQTYEVGPQAAELRLDEAGLALDGRIRSLMFGATSEMLPVPVMVGLAGMEYRLTSPVNRTEGPEDAAVALSLEGVELGDGVWGMLDPGGQLPREPASVAVDATAAVEVLVDLLDVRSLAALADAGDGEVPAMLHGLRVRELLVEALGARLTGTGDVTFDNADDETYGGFPAPEGVIELVLAGGNALLDRLVDAQLLPADQAGGVRMMMGVFTVAGEGADTLTSTIEMKPGGVIEANGQRVR